MDLYRKVRLAYFQDGQSKRAIGHRFGISRDSVDKTNVYLVRVAFGHREVWILGYVDQLVIGCGGEIIARYPRSYGREDMIFDPVHYLPLIEKKIRCPGSVSR